MHPTKKKGEAIGPQGHRVTIGRIPHLDGNDDATGMGRGMDDPCREGDVIPDVDGLEEDGLVQSERDGPLEEGLSLSGVGVGGGGGGGGGGSGFVAMKVKVGRVLGEDVALLHDEAPEHLTVHVSLFRIHHKGTPIGVILDVGHVLICLTLAFPFERVDGCHLFLCRWGGGWSMLKVHGLSVALFPYGVVLFCHFGPHPLRFRMCRCIL